MYDRQLNNSTDCSSNSRKSNTLNLHRNALGQLTDGNAAPGGLGGEELLVGGVHFPEIGHVCEEDLFIITINHSCTTRQTKSYKTGGERRKRKRKKEKGRKPTLTLTILSNPDPAASRIALTLLQHASVFWPMEPSTSVAVLSAGIWPETKIWPFALIAWD